MRAYIQFEKPVQKPSNKKSRQKNMLILNLKDFHAGSWVDFKKKYSFKRKTPFFIDSKCEISIEELYALLGASYTDAVNKIKVKNPTLSDNEILQEPLIIDFYSELKINDINKVTLAILEVAS